MTEGSTATRFRVEGMDCAGCASKVDTAARRVAGVEDVSVSVAAGVMSVRHRPDADLASLQSNVASLGYRVAPLPDRLSQVAPSKQDDHDCCGGTHDHSAAHEHAHKESSAPAGLHGHDHGPDDRPWYETPKGRLTIASGVALAAAWLVGRLFPLLDHWPFAAAMLVGLLPIAWRAIAAARLGSPFTIEMLMTIAAVGATIIGATEEAAAVVFLFLIGELLEGVAAGRARASIRALTDLVPKTALVEKNGETREIPAESIAIGDLVLVRPGDRIAADGEIVSGESHINEAPVTGESVPVRKGAGDKAFAGTVNGDAALRLRVTAAASDNTIARVVRLVEEAQESKAPTERLIDRFSRYYTPSVMGVAALVAIAPPLLWGGAWSEWVYKGLAILLIGCPCALVISVPAAIAASLSAGARRGLLIKGGAVLEKIGKATVACFDKTGTLTEGKPVVTDIVPFGRSQSDLLGLAAAVETGSSHPLAAAILARAAADGVAQQPAANARALGGKGVIADVAGSEVFVGSPQAASARVELNAEQDAMVAAMNSEGKTVSVVVTSGAIAGLIAMRDEPRGDATSGLAALETAGVKTIMLTGDNRRTAEAIGKQLKIEARAELMPQDKQCIVAELQKQGAIVIKVGDGINDAPALAAADVGIAMGGGTDVALETADAAALQGRVGDVAAMIDLSRRAMRNIRENIVIELGLKAVFLVTTVIGITGLWPAILADTGATVLVTINALRMLRGNSNV